MSVRICDGPTDVINTVHCLTGHSGSSCSVISPTAISPSPTCSVLSAEHTKYNMHSSLRFNGHFPGEPGLAIVDCALVAVW